MRDCDLDQMEDCTIAETKIYKPAEYDNTTDKRTITMVYHVTIGGPNPCSCRPIIQSLIEGYTPPEPEEGEEPSPNVPIPSIGDLRVDDGHFYFLVGLRINAKSDRTKPTSKCRFWVVTARWETQSRERQSRQPQDRTGTPTNNVDDSQALVRYRSGSETVPVEYAQFHGVYDHKGEPVTCDFKDNRYVCQPLKRADVGDFIPVMNSAGVRFDPPLTKDEGTEKLVIAKAYSAIRGNFVKELKNKINCDSFFIVEYRNGKPTFGRVVEPFTCRVSDVSVADDYLPNGSQFRVVSIELSFRDNYIDYLNEFGQVIRSENFGWDDLVPNRGLSHLIYPGEDDFNGGTWAAGPLLMGGAANAPITVGGQQVTDPQWLDCNGLPFINTSVVPPEVTDPVTCSIGVNPDNILYLRYRKYGRAIKFASNANFPNFLGNVFYTTSQTVGPDSLPFDDFKHWFTVGHPSPLVGTVLQEYADFDFC